VNDRRTGTGICDKKPLPAMDRVLMLIALNLDPRYSYTNYELQSAWRRRISQVHPDNGGNEVVAAAVNASYVTLVAQTEELRPINLKL
jgi:hypothetical protein